MIVASLILSMLLLDSGASFRLVEDADKRGFDELGSIKLDIDGDGRRDVIKPRVVRRSGWVFDENGRRKRGSHHWIAFDLTPARTGRTRTIFEYRYGDSVVDYWVWALIPAGDMDGDGNLDLVFYTGDDTTDETVVLLQRDSRFRQCSTGSILGDYNLDSHYNVTTIAQLDVRTLRDLPARTVGRWNARRARFEGCGMFWIRLKRLALRAEPNDSADNLQWLGHGDAVIGETDGGKLVSRGRWVKVDTTFGTGWVHRDGLVENSALVRQ